MKFIVSIVGERDHIEALEVIQMAGERGYRDLIVGVGMATCEEGLSVEKFEEAFKLAREEYGFKTTSHFWDCDMVNDIKRGLKYCCLDRIDHGISVLDDPDFLDTCT